MQKHKVLSFLLALLISIVLWVYAVTVVNPNDTASIRGVRVRLVGETELKKNHLMLVGGDEQFVDVEISGKRSDLKELNSSSLEAIADVSNIDGTGEYEITWTLDPPATVASGDIKLVASSANKIKVKVSEYQERPAIPVEVEYVGELAQGYLRDPAVLGTETLEVSGPAEEVNTIARAVITVDLEGANGSMEGDFAYEFRSLLDEPLEMSKYVTVSAETVRVSVPVLPYKDITLELAFKDGGGATKDDVTCTLDPPLVRVTGSEETLAKLADTLIVKEIDLAQIAGTTELTLTPELPTGVTNRASDKTVKVKLSFTGLVRKSFTVPCSSIVCLNDVPTLDFAEQSVVVTVRGKPEEVNALKAESIQITADMTNDYDSATKTVTLSVSLPATSKAGVIGAPYTVQVVEVEPEPTEP